MDGRSSLYDFSVEQDEARQALGIIKYYRMNSQRFVGRPDPSLVYLLMSGKAPRGGVKGEDCVRFDPRRAAVTRAKGRWKIADGNHWLFDFGDKEAEARTALAIIRKYGFTHSCFAGRPKPSFQYLRR